MAKFCISDLHLGDRGPRDNFCRKPGREESLLAFRQYVNEQNGDLYVLGDLFDWWQVNLSASIVNYSTLMNKLQPFVWVAGNHDAALNRFFGSSFFGLPPVVGRFKEKIGEKVVLFAHGHEGDAYCNNLNPGVGELTAIISGMLEDKDAGRGNPVEARFLRVLERISALWRGVTFQRNRRDEAVAGMEKLREEAGADLVVCGHTHEPCLLGETYANSGCWSEQRDTCVRVDDDGTPHLFEWIDDEAVPLEL